MEEQGSQFPLAFNGQTNDLGLRDRTSGSFLRGSDAKSLIERTWISAGMAHNGERLGSDACFETGGPALLLDRTGDLLFLRYGVPPYM